MSETTRTVKDYGVVAVKGAAMGAADVVPGVSGGTSLPSASTMRTSVKKYPRPVDPGREIASCPLR